MNVLIVHRYYRLRGGEDVFLDEQLIPSLERQGIPHTKLLFTPLHLNSLINLFEFITMILGLESLRPSTFQIKKALKQQKHTHVLFNNFLPTLSLLSPKLAKDLHIKTLMWIHNGRLGCPNGLNYNGNESCNQCIIRQDTRKVQSGCFSSQIQRRIYQWIYRGGRVSKAVSPWIDHWVSSSKYSDQALKRTLQNQSISLKSTVIHMQSPVKPAETYIEGLQEPLKQLIEKPFSLFVGRISLEKGVDRILELAQKYPLHLFVIAGTGPEEERLRLIASKNVAFLGFVTASEKMILLKYAHTLLVCSRVPENSPVILFESHPFRTPVIYSKGGGAEEIVHFLGRSGCAMSEFDPKTHFQRTGKAFTGNEFDICLKDLLH